jgi:2-methylcitrate dehydratase PrpD
VTSTEGVTAAFADFVASADAAAIPEHVKHAARRTIANSVCLSAAAAYHPAVQIALAVAQSAGVGGPARIIGRPERTSTAWAATLNAMSAHVEDFDDTHLRTVTHPGAPIVPAALAMAERTGAGGDDVLTAVILGAEVALRVGNGICPGHFDRCWHVTGTVGHLGAAVAAARLLGLDRERLGTAIAIAATEAAGVQDALGTMTKCLNPGKAAGDGVRAAQLAQFGLAGPPDPIEGRHGLGEVMAPIADYAEMTRGIGTRWEIVDRRPAKQVQRLSLFRGGLPVRWRGTGAVHRRDCPLAGCGRPAPPGARGARRLRGQGRMLRRRYHPVRRTARTPRRACDRQRGQPDDR